MGVIASLFEKPSKREKRAPLSRRTSTPPVSSATGTQPKNSEPKLEPVAPTYNKYDVDRDGTVEPWETSMAQHPDGAFDPYFCPEYMKKQNMCDGFFSGYGGEFAHHSDKVADTIWAGGRAMPDSTGKMWNYDKQASTISPQDFCISQKTAVGCKGDIDHYTYNGHSRNGCVWNDSSNVCSSVPNEYAISQRNKFMGGDMARTVRANYSR